MNHIIAYLIFASGMVAGATLYLIVELIIKWLFKNGEYEKDN